MDKIVHFEIPFDDKEKAMKFYKDVFDWKLHDMREMNYIMAHTVEVDDKHMPKESGAINGGMYKRDTKSSNGPVLVINVKSIDAYIKKIEQADGKIVREKMQVGDMGLYAQFEDTEGNILGIWEDIKHKKD